MSKQFDWCEQTIPLFYVTVITLTFPSTDTVGVNILTNLNIFLNASTKQFWSSFESGLSQRPLSFGHHRRRPEKQTNDRDKKHSD